MILYSLMCNELENQSECWDEYFPVVPQIIIRVLLRACPEVGLFTRCGRVGPPLASEVRYPAAKRELTAYLTRLLADQHL